MPVEKDKQERIIPKLKRDTWLEQQSRDVFLGHDSFWTGDTEKESTHTQTDYRSLVLVPIPVEEENIGLLKLKKKGRNFFKKKDVELYEGVAQTMGIALGYRRAQVELRERVKELMCLYGIAKIVEQGNLPLEEILPGIVNLLPPAWLYPDIASARIFPKDLPGNSGNPNCAFQKKCWWF